MTDKSPLRDVLPAHAHRAPQARSPRSGLEVHPLSVGRRCERVSDWFEGGGNGSPVDVRALLDAECTSVLWDIVGLGALVSLGTTADGGALGVTVTVDGRWRRVYVRDTDDLAAYVSEAFPAVEAALGGPSASPGSRKRTRSARGR